MMHIVVVLGTRPEAIKLAPLLLELRRRRLRTTVLLSGQHADLVSPILRFFGIKPDIDLRLMHPGQNLAALTARAVTKLAAKLTRLRPAWVVVQGDTTTAMAAALASFYERIPVAHLEAGLRTHSRYSPFPEEINRRIISQIATLHWCPTRDSAAALRRERLPLPPGRIVVTGNTVIDALLTGVQRVRNRRSDDADITRVRMFLAGGKERRLVLVTGHRRENFGGPLEGICRALSELAHADPDTMFLYPVHPNPKVRTTVYRLLADTPRVLLTAPKDYPAFLQLLDLAHIIVTDSGGVQEEAPALGKVVIVTRDTTERPEGLRTGLVRLAGNHGPRMAMLVRRALAESRAARRKLRPTFPYGRGDAANRCVNSLLTMFHH